jgi:hypothetical protein
MAGISMGYADSGDAGVDIRQPRLPLDDYATCNGFEEDRYELPEHHRRA